VAHGAVLPDATAACSVTLRQCLARGRIAHDAHGVYARGIVSVRIPAGFVQRVGATMQDAHDSTFPGSVPASADAVNGDTIGAASHAVSAVHTDSMISFHRTRWTPLLYWPHRSHVPSTDHAGSYSSGRMSAQHVPHTRAPLMPHHPS
jgi:hypothetical protein